LGLLQWELQIMWRSHHKAFTIVELLVVIAIISLVMSVMPPALGGARRRARSIVCMSNLRQLALAAQIYAGENDGYYPMAYAADKDPTDSLTVYACWDFIQTKDWNSLEKCIEPGLLWQSSSGVKVQQCPSFRHDNNSEDPYTGYNYNTSYIGRGSREAVTFSARTADVLRPESCALFADAEYAGGPNKFMRSPWTSLYDTFPFRASGTQGFRHMGRVNVVWCDGHVDSRENCYTDAPEPERETIVRHNATSETRIGFLSPDNSAYDLR